jgi:hypothetical protein
MNHTMKTTTDENNPPVENEIRSDLWPTMSVGQLYKQQELVIDKITKLHSMASIGGAAATPTVAGLLKALQQALTDLSQLIESRSTPRPKKPLPDSNGK